MSHVMIYAPDGEPFEVQEHMVGELVLNKGWSQQKPETVAIAAEPAPVVYEEEPPHVEEIDDEDEDDEQEAEDDEPVA
jgi:hypothetical protein